MGFLGISMSGIYTIERMADFNWSLAASGLLFAYHFLPLQLLAVVGIFQFRIIVTVYQLMPDFICFNWPNAYRPTIVKWFNSNTYSGGFGPGFKSWGIGKSDNDMFTSTEKGF